MRLKLFLAIILFMQLSGAFLWLEAWGPAVVNIFCAIECVFALYYIDMGEIADG